MMEIPIVCINVQRAGPATGVPTKTEQGDLWQVLGAGQGDYPRIIVAPTTIPDCFKTVPKLFNLVDKFQCPGIILSDLLLSEGRSSVDPAELDFNVAIERGEVIGLNGATPPLNGGYKRYEINDSGISPRALPGTLGFEHVVATDDHDEDGVLISDEYTNPHKRQAMHEKRMRKMDSILPLLDAPKLWGAADAQVTLVGWGSTEGVVQEAIQKWPTRKASPLISSRSNGSCLYTAKRSFRLWQRVRKPSSSRTTKRAVRALSTVGDRHRRRRSYS